MSTLILFKLPGKQGYATCNLETLAEFPRVGHSYLFFERVYETTQVVEPLSNKGEGGNALLLKLMNLDNTDANGIAQAVQSMINLEDPSGIASGFEDEPEKVVLVYLKQRRQNVKLVPELELIVDVQKLSARVPGPDGESEK